MSRAKNAIFLQKEIESLIYLPDQIVQLDHLNQNFSNHYCKHHYRFLQFPKFVELFPTQLMKYQI
jgi:hypothetical protein